MAQPGLLHQWQHAAAEEIEIRLEIEEAELKAVDPGLLELHELLHHLLGCPDHLDIATDGATLRRIDTDTSLQACASLAKFCMLATGSM